MRSLRWPLWMVLTVLPPWTPSAPSAEIGYLESFALSPDRSEALKLLIPGSADYYFYTCLHLQNTQQFDKVDGLLPQWVARHGRTPQVLEIQLRQALLTYEQHPQQSLEFLRRHLGIEFNHQRQNLGESPDLPTELDQQLLDRQRLTQLAIGRATNLDGFEDAALDWLVEQPLDGDRRRALLSRLQRPDYPSLPRLIVEDLNYKQSRGFGSLGIHGQLLLPQLEECVRLKPDLLNQQPFVAAYLVRLQPDADTDWQRDTGEKEAYLDRLAAFSRRLATVHNSLKAHILFQRLAHDRTRGIYDKGRFLEYIQLPRNVAYVPRRFLEQEVHRRFPADLNADFAPLTQFPPIVVDEPLVREYLQHFFLTETATTPYEPYIRDDFLRHVLAETKIVNGLGDPEQWYSLLPPEMYERLKERIDLDLAPTNRAFFGADEPVALDVDVKNVRNLLIKVFEINARNYYRDHLREINTDIHLDGLIANDERTMQYDEAPVRRVRRHFEFPSLVRPGVYVIDFIGNGISSRALVRKGRLRRLVRTGTAGHIFTILDEQNRPAPDATLWLAGHEYSPSREGNIVVPFSNQPGSRPIVLSQGALSSLDSFDHESEHYALVAGIHVDRETLLARRPATVIIRPAVYLNGTPVTLQVLENVRLVVAIVDQDGVATTKEVAPFTLAEDREATYEFQTPPRLASIAFTLHAQVQNLSQRKKVDLSATQSFTVNSIDKSPRTEDLHLARIAGEYVLELLGKTGEPRLDRAVQIAVKHRDFREPVQVTLKTDRRGRIRLGRLTGVQAVTATAPEQTQHSWILGTDRHSLHQVLHGVAGEPIEIPWTAPLADPAPAADRRDRPSRTEVSLLELRGGAFARDRFDHVFLQDGMLVARGLPAGDFDLWLKDADRRVMLRLADGVQRHGYVLGANRHLEIRGERALQIAQLSADGEQVRVQLRHASRFSRVHVFAARYLPAHDPFANLGRVVDPEPYRIIPPKSDARYVSGRNIGDEYRYILERRFAPRFPGVMLDRPSLLLAPWAVRSTETGVQEAEAGSAFAASPAPPASMAAREPAPEEAGVRAEGLVTPNLDFLGESAAVLTNLRPDEQGVVTISRDLLGGHPYLGVVAVDPLATAFRALSLPERPAAVRDLRLTSGLSPDRHFTQQKRITAVPAGGTLELPDITTGKLEVYDSLRRVHGLYVTLSRSPQLVEFSFLLDWPKLTPVEKQANYSRYACHELNYFLSRKDPAFFQTVVKPHLANKKDKSFLDQWLLGEPLDRYLDPWRYGRLNIVERILLSRRIDADHDAGRRHVQELFELVPPDVERFNSLFLTALRGSALDASDALGLGDAIREQLPELKYMQDAREQPAAGLPLSAGGAAGRPPADGTPADVERLRESRRGRAAQNRRIDSADRKAGELQDAAKRDEYAGARAKGEMAGKEAAWFFDDAEARKAVRQLFRQLDKTQEWAENNYYQLPLDQQSAELVKVNAFWRDFAAHDANQPFLSQNFADASRNFTEMMFALAALDLPFEAGKHETKFEQARMTLTAATPLIALHEEIRETTSRATRTPILVSQNFFQANDRYRHEGPEQFDKFVTDEFLVHTVYGCQVVVTNPTSAPQKLDVLLQIPVGSVPVSGGEATRSVHLQLQPFSTQTIEYFFYFPAAGKFPHYPVHVARNEQLLAHADPVVLVAVEALSRIDRESWEYVSQSGSSEQVLEFLHQANLQRIDLGKIAFRMKERDFFLKVIDLLSKRHAYHPILWSYGIHHNHPQTVRQYLQHADAFVEQCGAYLDSPLLTIDPVARHAYQQLEYLPLVNARAHPLGRQRQILNNRLHAQYHALLRILGNRPTLDDDDRMAVTYYLLLQDRIDEAARLLAAVDSQRLATRLQYDYFAAYLALCREDVALAEQIATRYAQYPVDRWRNTFAAVRKQLDEVRGSSSGVLDPESREQAQSQLAATEPGLEFQIEGRQIRLTYQNLDRVTVNYYLMDVELLFSRNPFVQSQPGRFAHIRPNQSQLLDLPKDRQSFAFELPAELEQRNVLVEISGGGQTRSQSYYANSLAVQLTENYGQLRVVTANPGKPLPKVYVKVYARMKDGRVRFFKDGYTDLRGRFDYASLSTNELDFVERFALLVMSDEHGAIVREAGPPRQ